MKKYYRKIFFHHDFLQGEEYRTRGTRGFERCDRSLSYSRSYREFVNISRARRCTCRGATRTARVLQLQTMTTSSPPTRAPFPLGIDPCAEFEFSSPTRRISSVGERRSGAPGFCEKKIEAQKKLKIYSALLCVMRGAAKVGCCIMEMGASLESSGEAEIRSRGWGERETKVWERRAGWNGANSVLQFTCPDLYNKQRDTVLNRAVHYEILHAACYTSLLRLLAIRHALFNATSTRSALTACIIRNYWSMYILIWAGENEIGGFSGGLRTRDPISSCRTRWSRCESVLSRSPWDPAHRFKGRSREDESRELGLPTLLRDRPKNNAHGFVIDFNVALSVFPILFFRQRRVRQSNCTTWILRPV